MARKRKYTGPRCRRCRCTNRRACPGGCFWIEPDLCSACYKKSVIKKLNIKKAAQIVGRFVFMETCLTPAHYMIRIREALNYLKPYLPETAQREIDYGKRQKAR